MTNFLPTSDIKKIEIHNFIFHLIQTDADEPRYLDEIIISGQQKLFFKKLIRQSLTKAIEYEFIEEEGESIVLMIEMIDEAEEHFIQHSRQLTSLFHRFHRGNTSDGIFICALVSFGEDTSNRLLYLAKMDKSEVVNYKLETDENGKKRAVLEEVLNPIVEDDKAIQKAALIDINSVYEWDVLAHDRQKSGGEIAHYFKNFLHVTEKEINAILSTKVVAEVQNWAAKNYEELPDGQHIADYKERAVSYLRDATEFDSYALIEEVLPVAENTTRDEGLTDSLFRHLEKKELTEKTFTPDPEGIKKTLMRHKIQTEEGVSIIWEGAPEEVNIEIREINGQQQIVITTDRYMYR